MMVLDGQPKGLIAQRRSGVEVSLFWFRPIVRFGPAFEQHLEFIKADILMCELHIILLTVSIVDRGVGILTRFLGFRE
jgi:hypothetical protein